MISEKVKNIKILLFDLGGVVFHSYDLNPADILNINQMLAGIKQRADRVGVRVGILSSFDSGIVDQFKDSGITDLYSSSLDKVSTVQSIILLYDFNFDEIAYIGNDLLDIPLLTKCGFSAAPASARREVKRVVDYVGKSTTKPVLQEVIELIEKNKV